MRSRRTVLVTLATLSRQADAVADADVPLADLVPPIAALLELGPGDTAVTVARAGDMDDSFAADAALTLAEIGVLDGDLVVLHQPGTPPRRRS